jgi:hypothetical protein
MPSATILIADGSEEIEFVTPYDGAASPRILKAIHIGSIEANYLLMTSVLVRAGFETKSVGVGLLNIYATYAFLHASRNGKDPRRFG